MSVQGRSTILTQYGLAAAAAALAFVLTLFLQPILDRSPFLLFLGAVIITVWYADMGPALVTIGLSAIASSYLMVHPAGNQVVDTSHDLVRLLIFVVVSFSICAVVAARKRSEKALRINEARVRQLVESHIVGIIHSHFDGRILEANNAFLEMIGYTRDDLRAGALRWNAITPPEYLPPSEQAIKRLETAGFCRPFEKEYIRKDGSRVAVLIGAVRLEGMKDQAVSFVLDLTERKRMEQALKEARDQLEVRVREQTAELTRMNEELKQEISEHKQAEQSLQLNERRFRYLAEHMDEVFWFTQLKPERTLYVSPAFEGIWGRPVSELYGNPRLWMDCVHPEDRQWVQTQYEAWLDGRMDAYDIEYRILNQGGEIRWIHDRGVKEEQEGQPILVGGIATDITERKQTQEALSTMQVDLAHASRLQTMGELVASIAHEINQPLAAVVTNANTCLRWLTEDEPDYKELREAVEDIANDANRASDVIARIRELLKKHPLQTAQLDMNEVIRETIPLISNEMALNRVALRTLLEPTLPRLSGDRVQLQQVLLNLILNAIEAMSAVPETERELLIQTSVDESRKVVVQVLDTGVGLDPNTLDRIFDPFFTTKRTGMGMGLSISQSIIHTHGGKLQAKFNQPKGANVYFTLPTG